MRQLALPFLERQVMTLVLLQPASAGWIESEQDQARQNAEAWQDAQTDEFPYLKLDQMCEKCMYACKRCWRFAGLKQGSGRIYLVGPLCEVLWRFSPYNPLRWESKQLE